VSTRLPQIDRSGTLLVVSARLELMRRQGDHPRMADELSLGVQFARALADKDFAGVNDLLDPNIDFRGMTPSRSWEASDSQTLVTEVLTKWFEQSDLIESVDSVENDSFADRERVGYRFRVRNPDGLFLVEQQAYLSAREGRISWMRVLCSGYRPISPSE
jgi:hypothetical protein